MAHRFNPAHRHRLNSEERRRFLPPEKVLQEAGIKPGDKVIDIGAGTGFFALPAAHLTGKNGRVVAVDVSEEMLDELNKNVPDELKDVVEGVQGEAENLPFEDEHFDVAILANLLHESEDPARILLEAARVLKKDGRVIVVEWQKKQTLHGPPMDERLDLDEIKQMMSDAGLIVDKVSELEYHVLVRGKKRG